MKNKSLTMQVHNYAKLWGVVVRIQGGTACTNGTVITIPRFDISDEHSCRLACAYLAHESGHIAYTDFDLLAEIPRSKRLLYTLLNIVEDSRIERLMASKWIGVYENLLMLNQELSKIAMKKLSSLQDDTVHLIPRMLQITSWLCQKYIQQYDTEDYVLNTLKVYPSLKDFTYKLAKLLMDAPMCNNTQEAYDLAQKINTLIVKEYNTRKDKQPQQIQRANTDSTGGTDNTDNTDSTLKGSRAFNLGAEIFDMWSLARTIETSISIANTSTSRDDQGVVSECPSRIIAGNVDWLQHLDLGLSRKINNLTLALHNYVKAKTLSINEQVDVGRRLNVKRALRIPLGETNVWNKKTFDLDHNTSIHILVDSSLSMLTPTPNGNLNNYRLTRNDHAKICAYCIAKALEGVPNTESQVSFFPCRINESDTNYDIGICKQAWESVQSTIRYFDQKPSGSTPMAQAMIYAVSKFKYSDKDRNILLIITDGMPDSVPLVRQQLEQCKHLGVELRVLSINCERAEKLFSNCVVTNAEGLLDNASKVIKQLFS